MCRTFGSVTVVLFPMTCSFARGKGSLETTSYLVVFDCRHGFRSTLKYDLISSLDLTERISWIVSDVWLLQPNTAVSLRPF